MTRGLVFLASAMVAASLGVGAQEISGGAENNTHSAQHIVTITGCLNASSTGGSTVSDNHGSNFFLSGNTDLIRAHNGQEVTVSGVQQTDAGTSSNTSPISSIHVTAARVVADNCTGVAQKQSDAEADGSAVASVDDALNSGQLPQTSTILPLLGLIGLGSLVAGFFARH